MQNFIEKFPVIGVICKINKKSLIIQPFDAMQGIYGQSPQCFLRGYFTGLISRRSEVEYVQ